GVHALTVVAHGEHDEGAGLHAHVSSGVRAVHIRVGGLDDQAATMRHRVDRVDDEVHEHLLHLVRIDSDLSEVRVQRGHQLDVLPDQAPDDGLEVAHHV